MNIQFLLTSTLGLALILPAPSATVDDLTFTTENGEITITDCDPSAQGTLDIPGTIQSQPVVAIRNFAFWGSSQLTTINRSLRL